MPPPRTNFNAIRSLIALLGTLAIISISSILSCSAIFGRCVEFGVLTSEIQIADLGRRIAHCQLMNCSDAKVELFVVASMSGVWGRKDQFLWLECLRLL